MWRRIAFAALLVQSCASAAKFPEAPFEHRSATGLVRGNSEAEVRSVAAILDQVAVQVQSTLQPESLRPVKIVVVDLSANNGGLGETRVVTRLGRTVDQYICLSRQGSALYRFVVAHELVHWYADEIWDRLPIVLEEGLADLIACDLDPAGRARKDAMTAEVSIAASQANLPWALSLSGAQASKLEGEQKYVFYATGFRVATKLGIDGIRTLAVRARNEGRSRIPDDWILDACGELR